MIYVIAPFFNRRGKCERFLQALRRQTIKEWKLIAVDSSSTDGTPELISSALQDKAVIINAGPDAWWTKCVQLGLDHVNSCQPREQDIVLVCNDDIAFEDSFLEVAKGLVKPDSFTIAPQRVSDRTQLKIGSQFNDYWMSFSTVYLPIDCSDLDFKRAAASINCCETRSLFAQLGTLNRLGRLCTRTLPHYYADFEWTYRAHRMGIKSYLYRQLCIDTADSGAIVDTGLSFFQKCRTSFHKKSLRNPLVLSAFAVKCLAPARLPVALFLIWSRWLRWLTALDMSIRNWSENSKA